MDISIKDEFFIGTTPVIKKLFRTSGIHDFNKDVLVIIMSDSDSAFRGDNRDEDQSLKNIE